MCLSPSPQNLQVTHSGTISMDTDVFVTDSLNLGMSALLARRGLILKKLFFAEQRTSSFNSSFVLALISKSNHKSVLSFTCWLLLLFFTMVGVWGIFFFHLETLLLHPHLIFLLFFPPNLSFLLMVKPYTLQTYTFTAVQRHCLSINLLEEAALKKAVGCRTYY